jgi:hypothetical protein
MKKIFLSTLSLFTLNFLLLTPVHAVCPICTIAVGVGLGLSRYLGVDDTISGLWIGAITVSVSIWTINWLIRRKWNFKGYKILTFIIWYALIVLPLFFTNIVGHPLNKIFGIDKLLLGIIVGSILFAINAYLYQHLKKKNNDRAHFPFQKIIMPVGTLAIFSAIFYFLTK